MKRSEINRLLYEGVDFLEKMNFKLPPFAYWSPEQWKEKIEGYDEIFYHMLGWDITDFGSGDFYHIGLLLFTLRNGNLKNRDCPKTYAEKVMIIKEEQITPFHFHEYKTEDIINRGGGNLLIQLYNSTQDAQFDDTDILVSSDGRNYTVKAGSIIRLKPGESITLKTKLYHQFWSEKCTGVTLAGEVSMVNDDTTDNRFYIPAGRFPDIQEDEAPVYLLAQDYVKFVNRKNPLDTGGLNVS
ncbi:MAG TPA: D-lyxose/D-mannose family sugar isomerase [Clostridiales bacterium]|nr:D-lyxose/D-mannose family sugar isomerase [Clostridiales bacterium]